MFGGNFFGQNTFGGNNVSIIGYIATGIKNIVTLSSSLNIFSKVSKLIVQSTRTTFLNNPAVSIDSSSTSIDSSSIYIDDYYNYEGQGTTSGGSIRIKR